MRILRLLDNILTITVLVALIIGAGYLAMWSLYSVWGIIGW